jgi:sugar/nucleoside kinase (ribokinase family)
VELANKIVDKAKSLGVKLSFDVNFRTDIFKDQETAIKTYLPFINSADIVKFSDDELLLFTGERDIEKGCYKIAKQGQLIVVTLGKKGSFYYLDGKTGEVATMPVTPIDTTGAGDAFYGTFLAQIENVEYTDNNLKKAMQLANESGAKTTLFKGAIKL